MARLIAEKDIYSLFGASGMARLHVGDIDVLPRVDAVEVVHGHMVERIVDHECPWYTVYDCSECGCSIERWHTYCPSCGAKMDGGVKNA